MPDVLRPARGMQKRGGAFNSLFEMRVRGGYERRDGEDGNFQFSI